MLAKRRIPPGPDLWHQYLFYLWQNQKSENFTTKRNTFQVIINTLYKCKTVCDVYHKGRKVINMLQRQIERVPKMRWPATQTPTSNRSAPNNFITSSHLHYLAIVYHRLTNELTTNKVQASSSCCSIYLGLLRVKWNFDKFQTQRPGDRGCWGELRGSGKQSYFMEFIVFNKGRVMIWLGDTPRLPVRRSSSGGDGSARARLCSVCSRNIASSSMSYNRPIKSQSIRRMELFTPQKKSN